MPVHLGIVTGISDEALVTRYFRGLGYRSRGIGAEGLGRRIYIGPFTTQGAADQALAVAREAGFIAPYVAKYTPRSERVRVAGDDGAQGVEAGALLGRGDDDLREGCRMPGEVVGSAADGVGEARRRTACRPWSAPPGR